MSECIQLDGHSLDCAKVTQVAQGASIGLDPGARSAMAANAAEWRALGAPDILAGKESWLVGSTPVETDPATRLRAFVESHCAGVGPSLERSVVRALMICRANVLARACSGCRPEAAEILISMLEAQVHPVVPSQGSVGAAGDLAPLAHMARVVFRLGGKAEKGGEELEADEAMRNLPDFDPTSKEALSFINGATLAVAMGALACHRAKKLLKAAEIALAMSMEVVLASSGCLEDKAISARNHPGAVESAARVRALLEGSELVHSGRSPDAFSVRCSPAVLGGAWDALAYATEIMERELNGACDNPLVIDGEVVEAGNFHGAPIALALDHLKLALTQVGTICERRTFRLTTGHLSGNLPSFLLESSGLNSGFMLAQYTAASLASENKGLCFPASADSIPTGQHHEDHVSMAPIAARGLLQVLENLADIVAIEVLCAGQGLEFRREGASFTEDGERREGKSCSLAPRVSDALGRLREVVDRWYEDGVLHGELLAVGALVRSRGLEGLTESW